MWGFFCARLTAKGGTHTHEAYSSVRVDAGTTMVLPPIQ